MFVRSANRLETNPLFNLLRLSLLKMVLLFHRTRDQNTAIILPRAVFTLIRLIHKVKASENNTKPFEYRTAPATATSSG